MINKKYNELTLGIIIAAIGLIYLLLTKTVPKKSVADAVVDARTLPFILSSMLLFLGAIQIGVGIKKAKDQKEEEKSAEKEEKPSYSTVVKTMIVILVYVALLSRLGFLVMTAICLFLQFIILTPVDKKKNYILYAGIAVISSVVIYTAFRNGLNLMLPQGIFR